jgi:hypothetical protein
MCGFVDRSTSAARTVQRLESNRHPHRVFAVRQLLMRSCGIVCGTDDAIVLCDAASCLDTVALLADAIECAEDGTV